MLAHREKVLVLSVPAPSDLNARCPADLGSAIVQHLAAHVGMRAWPVGAEPGLGSSFSVATMEELRGGAGLPYELRALEAALLCLVRVLDREVGALEGATKPGESPGAVCRPVVQMMRGRGNVGEGGKEKAGGGALCG